MGYYFPPKFQALRFFSRASLVFFTFIYAQYLWAAQDAMVMVDKAVIFADEKMSAPVGFIRKGKRIKVGDVARYKAQVYPIIVSGKVAYIRVLDVSTEKESVDSALLVAERFQTQTREEQKTNYSLSFFNYSSQITLSKQNGLLKDKDPVNWFGVGIRGGVEVSPKWDLDIILNVMGAESEKEVFRAVEFGVGGALRILDKGRFKLRILAQLLSVPFSTYALGDKFRVIGYGFSTGGGLSATYRLGKNFGLEGYGGFYYTQLSGFKAPEPYSDIAPSFMGTRIGGGLVYQF